MDRPAHSQGPPEQLELQEFLERVRPKLRRLLVSWRVPLEDAEDLLQDSLVALHRRWHQMHAVASREAWLLGTLRLTILKYRRRRTQERQLKKAVSQQLAAAEAPAQERQDSARDVEALTAALPRRDRQVLWLRYGLELKPREAAAVLGCRPGSVRKLSQRALERVRRQLSGTTR
jgi:RNA polymerase sigma factor (sigma-70 family)